MVDAKLIDLVVVVINLASVVVVNVNAGFIELFFTNFGFEFLLLGTLSPCLVIRSIKGWQSVNCQRLLYDDCYYAYL